MAIGDKVEDLIEPSTGKVSLSYLAISEGYCDDPDGTPVYIKVLLKEINKRRGGMIKTSYDGDTRQAVIDGIKQLRKEGFTIKAKDKHDPMTYYVTVSEEHDLGDDEMDRTIDSVTSAGSWKKDADPMMIAIAEELCAHLYKFNGKVFPHYLNNARATDMRRYISEMEFFGVERAKGWRKYQDDMKMNYAEWERVVSKVSGAEFKVFDKDARLQGMVFYPPLKDGSYKPPSKPIRAAVDTAGSLV